MKTYLAKTAIDHMTEGVISQGKEFNEDEITPEARKVYLELGAIVEVEKPKAEKPAEKAAEKPKEK